MADADDELTVAQRLGRLLDRGLLPAGGPAEAAERLIERLERPARVALLGLPGSGKSAILNLLAGTVVVPETLRLPTIIVQHGHEPRMSCTLSDGRNEIIPGDNLEKSLSLSPALITLELDLPALKVISLLEIAAGPLESDQRRAALWAGKRADILIWCTTSYLPKEQLVWEGMPDAFKDNGFLLLTKVDLLGGREAAAGMHHRVEQRAGGEFRQVLSISAKEARAATLPSGQVDRGRFRESGAGSVISTIKTRVQSARRADTDTAELILARQASPGEDSSRRLVEVALPQPAVIKSPVTLVRPQEAEKTPLAVVAPLAPRPAPVSTPVIEKSTPPEVEPVVAAETQSQISVEPEPEVRAVPKSAIAPLQEVATEPGPPPEVTDDTVAEPETETRVAAETELVVEAVADPEVPPEPAYELVAVEPVDPEPTRDRDPVPEESPEPAVGFLTSAGGQRLSDRIKQIRPSGATTEAPLVPLRATWKSRNDVSSPAAAEVPVEPLKTPRPRPVDPSSVGKPSLRVSPAKDPASIKSDAPQSETEIEAFAEDRLKELRRTDDIPTTADIDQNAPSEASPEKAEDPGVTSGGHASNSGDPVKAKEAKADDPALARLSALWPSRPDTPVLSQSNEPEPEDEPATKVSSDLVAEDPALARLSALRQPRSETAVPARGKPPEPQDEQPASVAPATMDLAAVRLSGLRASRPDASARIRVDQPQSARPMPAEIAAKATSDDISIEIPVPAEPVAVSEPLPDEVSHADRDPRYPSAAVAAASDRRPLSARLSQAVGQTSGTPTSPESFPSLGPRMPRSGLPGSPRVTVLRERRVEVQPVEHRDQVRFAPAAGPVISTAMDEPATISAAEVELLDLAIGLIGARSAELFALVDVNEKLPVDLILEHGCETTERVIEVISKGNSAEMRRIKGSLSELQDVIMLMQLEKGHAPADDTLTMLLQLRREMETLRPV